ncbi:MAG: helix-turn-helix domain-containing protein [Lachnospiraceae bacterium]|nr:helix-turn-helix domain-containing protein [Lachnospiraceae bacterium]
MKRKKRYKNFKHKIFLILVLGSLLPFILMAFYTYHTYITEVNEKVALYNDRTLEQLKSSVDYVTESIRMAYLDVLKSDSVKWFFDEDVEYSSYTRLKQAGDSLSGPVFLRNYISSYALINFKTGCALTNYRIYEKKDISNYDEILKVEQETLKERSWSYLMNADETTGTIPLSDLSFVIKAPLNAQNTNSLLIVNLNWYQMKLLMQTELESGAVVVFDNSGKVIYSENEIMSDFIQSIMPSYSSLNDMSKHQNEFAKKAPEKFSMIYSKSSGWLYVQSYTTKTVNHAAFGILYTAIIIGMLEIILIFLLARFGTKRIYSPISNLVQNVHQTTQDPKGMDDRDEFTYIDNRFHALISSNRDMETVIDHQKIQLAELFTTRLFKGLIKKEELDEKLAMFHIVLSPLMCMITTCIYENEEEKELKDTEQDYARIRVMDNMPGSITNQLLFPVISNNDVMIMIVGANTEEDLEKKCFVLIKQLNEYIKGETGCQAKYGVSKTFSDVFGLRQSYNESAEAMKNNDHPSEEVNALEDITFYSDIAAPSQNTYQYDVQAERMMQKAIDECDKEEAYRLFNEFLNHLLEEKVVFHELSFHLHRMMIAVLLVATNAGLSLNHIFGDSACNLFDAFNRLSDVEKIRWYFKHRIIAPVIDQLKVYRKNSSELVLEKVTALISQSKGDITLTECADQLGYHPSYIWKIMKNKVDMTFSDYIIKVRMEYAKKLLTETERSVGEIAEDLNYTNAQNFIRFFSKHEGITPGKYRSLSRKAKEIEYADQIN